MHSNKIIIEIKSVFEIKKMADIYINQTNNENSILVFSSMKNTLQMARKKIKTVSVDIKINRLTSSVKFWEVKLLNFKVHVHIASVFHIHQS